MRNDMHTTIAWAGFALGLFLLTLQATLTIPLRMAEGGGFFRALVFYFSFFTVLSNLGVTLVYFAVASGRKRLRFLAGPTARTMMAGSILVVMVVYAVLLQSAWNPQGLMKLSDIGLHYVAPLLYLGWWISGPHPVRLRWDRARVMMLYPVIYLVWVVVRGITIGRWPYPFVSVPDLGWGLVIANMAGMAVLFLVVYLAFIGVSRVLNARSRYGMLAR
jgi:hypothetical protein